MRTGADEFACLTGVFDVAPSRIKYFDLHPERFALDLCAFGSVFIPNIISNTSRETIGGDSRTTSVCWEGRDRNDDCMIANLSTYTLSDTSI